MEDGPQQPNHWGLMYDCFEAEERARQLELALAGSEARNAVLEREKAELEHEVASVKAQTEDFLKDLAQQGRLLTTVLQERDRYLDQVRRYMRALGHTWSEGVYDRGF